MRIRNIDINLKLCITDQDVEDVVVTAIEGGIGYWACLDNTPNRFDAAPDDEPVSITVSKILLEGGNVTLIDERDKKEYVLTLDKLISGIKKYVENSNGVAFECSAYGRAGELDCCNVDSCAADEIIQYAIFDEVIYG